MAGGGSGGTGEEGGDVVARQRKRSRTGWGSTRSPGEGNRRDFLGQDFSTVITSAMKRIGAFEFGLSIRGFEQRGLFF